MRKAAAVALLLLAACSGEQSALAPLGYEARRIASLTWLLFGGGAAIFLITMVVLLLAVDGGRRTRRTLASPRLVFIGGVGFPVVVLTALLIHILFVARGLTQRVDAEPLVVEVIGRQFWWEVRYPDQGFVTANEIRLPMGREVELRVTSQDVIHSLWVPSLHGKIDLIPGRVNTLRVRLERPGLMRGQCAEFCGSQHARMALHVESVDDDAFAAWSAVLRRPVMPPEDPFLAEGWAAFGTAGCGSCHAIRGTAWAGSIGPDLTAIGLRHAIGAGTLRNHRATLAGWIAGSQALKPDNPMPDFAAVLDGRQLRSLAAFLDSMR